MTNVLSRVLKRSGVDNIVNLCVIILTVFGIVMIGSASVGQTAKYGTIYATKNMMKQAFFVAIGYALKIVCTRFFKKSWVNDVSTWVFYGLGLLAMISCLLFKDVKGSHAWIRFGSVTIQPAEFMKVVMILFCAFRFGELEELCQMPKNISRQKREELYVRKFNYCIFKPIMAAFVVFGIGAFVQNDTGSALIIAFICMMIFFATPLPYFSRWKKIILIVLTLIGLVIFLLLGTVLQGYQIGRITTWLNPLGDTHDASWQLTNALVAFSTGGLIGKGFGKSTQKYGYIPESHNDFISAIIFEELGLAGFMLFLIPYCIIIYKMFNYGFKIKDTKSKLVLYGVGIYFFTQLFVNVGGVSGLIPMTGVPLLLISSGGSSTWSAMIAIGIAQSIIAKYNRDSLKEQI